MGSRIIISLLPNFLLRDLVNTNAQTNSVGFVDLNQRGHSTSGVIGVLPQIVPFKNYDCLWHLADVEPVMGDVRCRGDTVAKVENRTTLKISRK
jgi:hypothetical protein